MLRCGVRSVGKSIAGGESDGSHAGESHADRGNPQTGRQSADPVDRETYWLNLWAYATSPHGLGLSSKRSWALTPREFSALQKQHESMVWHWALERAEFRNAHFQTDSVPWEPADFMGSGKREERKLEHQIGKLEVAKLTAKMHTMKSDEVPDIFKGEYAGDKLIEGGSMVLERDADGKATIRPRMNKQKPPGRKRIERRK